MKRSDLPDFLKGSGRPRKVVGGRDARYEPASKERVRTQWAHFERVAAETREKYPQTVARLESIVESVSFETVADIFREYMVKSGLNPDRTNVLSRKDCFVAEIARLTDSKDELYAAGYEPHFNVIVMDPSIVGMKIGFPVTEQAQLNEDVEVVAILFHELTHAAARNSSLVAPDGDALLEVTSNGLAHKASKMQYDSEGNHLSKQEVVALYVAFNEGVTERISDEVLFEYARRQSFAKEHASTRSALYSVVVDGERGDRGGYAPMRLLVTGLVNAIAHHAKLPEEVVWGGIKRQYFSGEFHNSKSIFVGLVEIVGLPFAKKLAAAKSSEEVMHLLEELPGLVHMHEEAIDTWLGHLDLSRGAK